MADNISDLATNATYNSIWAANATTFNRTAEIYSKEQEHAAIYVIVVVMTYACSIFALLTLVLCKKKPEFMHTDRDVDRFLRDIESVRAELRRRDQKYEVTKFIQGINPRSELVRTQSVDLNLGNERVKKIRPPLRRSMSERDRTVHFDDVPAHLVPTGSFEAVSSDSETSLSPLIHTLVDPPSYEGLQLKSIIGGFIPGRSFPDQVHGTAHCQSCSCHLHMGHQNRFVPAPVTPPGSEVALVHDHRPVGSVNFYHSTPGPQYNGRPMLHSSSGPTRIPRPVIRATTPRMPFIDEHEEHNSSPDRNE